MGDSFVDAHHERRPERLVVSAPWSTNEVAALQYPAAAASAVIMGSSSPLMVAGILRLVDVRKELAMMRIRVMHGADGACPGRSSPLSLFAPVRAVPLRPDVIYILSFQGPNGGMTFPIERRLCTGSTP